MLQRNVAEEDVEESETTSVTDRPGPPDPTPQAERDSVVSKDTRLWRNLKDIGGKGLQYLGVLWSLKFAASLNLPSSQCPL